jgi:hypothetical protein
MLFPEKRAVARFEMVAHPSAPKAVPGSMMSKAVKGNIEFLAYWDVLEKSVWC